VYLHSHENLKSCTFIYILYSWKLCEFKQSCVLMVLLLCYVRTYVCIHPSIQWPVELAYWVWIRVLGQGIAELVYVDV
jgi:hypothetical protein